MIQPATFISVLAALTTTGTRVNDGETLLYRASKADCDACAVKPRCCPNTPARKVPRSIHERARDMARAIANSWEGRTSRRLRKKVEMLFAHLKRILRLDRLRLRGPNGARDELLLAAAAQNLRKRAKLVPMPQPKPAREVVGSRCNLRSPLSRTDFFNGIDPERSSSAWSQRFRKPTLSLVIQWFPMC
jgi:Transposase DDE domain